MAAGQGRPPDRARPPAHHPQQQQQQQQSDTDSEDERRRQEYHEIEMASGSRYEVHEAHAADVVLDEARGALV